MIWSDGSDLTDTMIVKKTGTIHILSYFYNRIVIQLFAHACCLRKIVMFSSDVEFSCIVPGCVNPHPACSNFCRWYFEVKPLLFWNLGLGTGLSALLTVAAPLIARAGVGPFIASRVVQGIVEGPFYPALYVIVGKWLPKEEKGNLFNLIFIGMYYSTMLSGCKVHYLE